MISSYRRLLSAFAVAIFPMVMPAAAQTSDLDQLPRLIKTGEIVTIVDLEGTEARGRVQGISGGVLEIQPITPGEAPNEYRTTNVTKTFPLDRIAGLSRVNALGGNPELVYQHRDSFGTLPQRLKPGELVRVIERSGDATIGKVTDVSSSKLVLTIRKSNARDGSGRSRHEWGGSQTFVPFAVEKIERPAHIWDGAVKGAAVAALATLLVASGTCRGDCPGLGAVYVFTGGIGAGIGLGIDALFPAKRIYRAPKP